MTDAPFLRYRERLEMLANGSAVNEALAATGRLINSWPRGLQWRPMFSRFYPDSSPYAVQVLESHDGDVQRVARVDAFETPEAPSSGAQAWCRHPRLGHLRVTRVGADVELPSLGPMLAEQPGAAIVRYHPGLRCTFRCMKNGRVVYGKMFRDTAGPWLYGDAERLWRASVAGELTFSVARPLAWHDATRTLWQVELPGYPIVPRLCTAEGPLLARRIGLALGSLAMSRVLPVARQSADEQVGRSIRHAADLRRRVPDISVEIERFLDWLLEGRARLRPGRLRPTHGAAHPPQWLSTNERVGLVDFDRFAAGDPELDVATMLSDLDFERRLRNLAPILAGTMIAAWESVAGPLDRDRLTFYRAHRHLQKAWRRACSLRPDADREAAASLRGSMALLAAEAAA